jgi:nitrite reductase/ring-hydroxylating ferredoxin subunit
MAFEQVAQIGDIPKTGGLKVSLASGTCLLFRVEDRVRAVNQRCPHLGVPLRAQDVNAEGVVTCWFHGAQFEGASGAVLRPPLSKDWQRKIPLGFGTLAAAVIPKKCKALASYAVEIRGSAIWVNTRANASSVREDTK